MIGVLAVAAQLAIVAHAPDTVSACDAVEVSVAVRAPGRTAPVVVPPSLAPFDVLRSPSVPRITYDSRGAGSVLAEYRYVITTDQVGTFVIPSFEAHLGSAVSRSRPRAISVHGPAHRNVPTVVARARVDTSLRVNFKQVAAPETVFVGQQANYEVAVFLNEAVRDRLRRNPTFFPPDMQSMLAYDLPTAGDPPRRQVGSHCFDALVYRRALFPLMPGRFAIPPAQLVYALPLSASFFSREETHELQTDSTIVVVVEPPERGRPADYGGAVGRLRIAARLDTLASRVGDPMRLTLRVAGTGNVKLFPRPRVGVSWGSLVKADERVYVDSTARRIAGAKEFDWVLTPRVAGELDLPPIRYTYFNPDRRRYEAASTAPLHVHISPGSLASSDTERTEQLLPLRVMYRGPARVPLHQSPVFWTVLALAPLPALTLRGRERRRSRQPQAQSRIARLEALARGPAVAASPAHDRDAAGTGEANEAGGSADASELRRAFAGALGERLHLEAGSFARPGTLTRALRRRGVSADLAGSVERFIRQLDEAAFAASGSLPPGAARRAVELYRQVDGDALHRTRIAARVSLVVVAAVALGAGALQAFDSVEARAAFQRGIAAYDHHDFVAAREAFIASVVADPTAPDAWADLGTASWAIADTARGVAAWQRALRMEPLASDVRQRVELVHALPWSSAGYVLPLPSAWVFDLAALIWLAAWGAAAWRASRGGRLATRSTLALGSGAVLLLIAGFALSDALSGRRLAVVRETASLSSEPELGGERSATAIIGEVVRVTGRQGAWSRLRLDDGRDGWIESAALMPLDSRDASEIRAN